jgi:hypothetical protein
MFMVCAMLSKSREQATEIVPNTMHFQYFAPDLVQAIGIISFCTLD